MILRTRSAYQTALETGRSAEEAADPTAAREFAALWDYIAGFALPVRDRRPPPPAHADADARSPGP